jgi:hypothetical protein
MHGGNTWVELWLQWMALTLSQPFRQCSFILVLQSFFFFFFWGLFQYRQEKKSMNMFGYIIGNHPPLVLVSIKMAFEWNPVVVLVEISCSSQSHQRRTALIASICGSKCILTLTLMPWQRFLPHPMQSYNESWAMPGPLGVPKIIDPQPPLGPCYFGNTTALGRYTTLNWCWIVILCRVKPEGASFTGIRAPWGRVTSRPNSCKPYPQGLYTK